MLLLKKKVHHDSWMLQVREMHLFHASQLIKVLILLKTSIDFS